jgi:uncharacterized protein (TIGR03545 family)
MNNEEKNTPETEETTITTSVIDTISPETEETTGKNPVPTPGVFKKPIKEKKLKRRFLKYIEHPGDKKFFTGCFTLQEEEYVIRNDLTKLDVKKLKVLLKWVKKNRKGPLKIVPLLFTGAVVAAFVIFFTIFANPLLEYAAEKGLEAAFEARSDVDNLRISLLKFRIAIGGVTVANRDKPMTNLFQLGRTEIRLRPAAVLRGKIYIEEIRSDNIRFGTERTYSGALPGKPPREKVKKEAEKVEGPPLIDLQNFDAMALLNQEYDKLKTPKLYDQAINAYNETAAKWKGEIEGASAKVSELRNSAQPILSINVSSLRDPEAIQKTIQDINAMVSSVQGAVDDATRMVNGIENDINTAKQLEQNARTAITDDINHLKSYINLEGGAAFAAVEPFIRDILSDTAEQYLDYGLMALEILENLKDQAQAKPKTEKPKKEEKVVFKGRDVIFPLRAYPQFFLGILASDFTLDAWNWALDLRDVSSNPDLTGKPVSLDLGLTESGGSLNRKVAFKGSADFRTNPVERYNAVVNGSGFPLSLGDQLSKVGINGFRGETAFSVNMSGRTDGGFSTGGDVKISQARLVDPKGIIAEAADTAIQQAPFIDLGIQYNHWVNQKDEFKITTNLLELLAQAIKNMVQAYAKKAMDEIERVLREKIAQYIDGKFVSKEEVDALFKIARGDKAAVDTLRSSLNNKKNEFEQRIKNMANEAVQQVKDEAAQQGQQAAQDILQGNQPSLQSPSLPSLPSSGGGIKIPGR